MSDILTQLEQAATDLFRDFETRSSSANPGSDKHTLDALNLAASMDWCRTFILVLRKAQESALRVQASNLVKQIQDEEAKLCPDYVKQAVSFAAARDARADEMGLSVEERRTWIEGANWAGQWMMENVTSPPRPRMPSDAAIREAVAACMQEWFTGGTQPLQNVMGDLVPVEAVRDLFKKVLNE